MGWQHDLFFGTMLIGCLVGAVILPVFIFRQLTGSRVDHPSMEVDPAINWKGAGIGFTIHNPSSVGLSGLFLLSVCGVGVAATQLFGFAIPYGPAIGWTLLALGGGLVILELVLIAVRK